MDIDPEDLFREDADSDSELQQEREATKELVVYLIDASPKMFVPLNQVEDEKGETPFHIVISCVLQSLKTQIIAGSIDEVAVCFFNTKEKKNLQEISGVYVFNVIERESLDRPTARLIKEFSTVEESFRSKIGSCYAIAVGSGENSIYNALWVAQALLRKGSSKTASKRILMFTNEDDPFGSITGPIHSDMVRTTLQRAKDAQDLGISLELLPLSRTDEDFDVSKFYAELLGLEGEELSQFVSSAGESEKIKFSVDEISEVKRIGTNYLRLLGFKPLDYLKDYHNLRSSTFVFPCDEDVLGSTRIFIALHRSMIRLQRFAVAFYGSSARPQLVALIAQDEITSSRGQVEPPGMHMIHLPYSDDIRYPEELQLNDHNTSHRPTDDQIEKASTLLRCIDLKNFSVCQFSNPGTYLLPMYHIYYIGEGIC